jgi:NAD(P)-dependent dehydrogenase (short-subunit alcohol dehydrogenase family)
MKELIKETRTEKLFSVRDKVVLIIGAGGIGEYFVRGFADNGANVIFTNSKPGKADQVLSQLKEAGLRGDARQLDSTDKAAVQAMTDDIVEKYGRIDVLINTAGIGAHAAPENYEESLIRKILDVNLMSAIFVTQIVGKVMIRQKAGRIIHISSTAASHVGTLESTPYGISKAGLNMLVKNCAVIWARHNINVNAISPAWTWTPMISVLPEDYVQEITDFCNVGRMCYPEDLLGAAIFLSSDASCYISGQEITVDAGNFAGKTVKITENS